MKRIILNLLAMALLPGVAHGAMSDHAQQPPLIQTAVDANVMINLSVETPMQGAAYNDWDDGGACPGRPGSENGKPIGNCYFADRQYIGYFDSGKCYVYDSTDQRFEPAAAADGAHRCNRQWSGNMLNWATMTAIDEFRWALTGGHRSTDTASETVLERAVLDSDRSNGHSWFPVKKLGTAVSVDPDTVMPSQIGGTSVPDPVYLVSYGTQIKVCSEADCHPAATVIARDIYARVKVCDEDAGLEESCRPYGSHHKPEGLIQGYANNLRFAVMSYLLDNSHGRHGGVLRANMKYVGPFRPAPGGGIEVNPGAEWSPQTGVFMANPDRADASASHVANSGVINYINKFGADGYKAYDPIGELFYECVNYYKNRGPTAEYSADLTAAMKDGFPVITAWKDPITHRCQRNYIIGINDANPWEDKRLPGTAISGRDYQGYSMRSESNDWGEPSHADSAIDVTSLTNAVGDLQGITGTSQCVGCVPGDCDMSATNKTISELGRAFGTCPYAPKENSYYIAGLAYYANTHDLRSDHNGRQTVTTFLIDTQEYSSDPLLGQMNMLWLAGKFGGFEEINHQDTNNDGNPYEPDQQAEWDADGDGEPDNYVLATNPERLVTGLSRAFTDIERRLSAGSAAAVIANEAAGDGQVIQALYQPKLTNTNRGQQVQWVGLVHAIFIDDQGHLREDTNGNATLEDCDTDRIITVEYDVPLARTVVKRHACNGDLIDSRELDNFGTVWDARDQLAALDNDAVEVQRAYNTAVSANNTRHIFTWIDENANGAVDPGEVIAFDPSHIDADNYRYLDVNTLAEARDIVNFVRGHDGISGFRSRRIDYDNDGTDEILRLGDVVHSSPAVVGPPRAGYDTQHNDDSYAEFRAKYQNRRQMVYVGANDGMLHAFNSGFWDPAQNRFELQAGTGTTAHPLGAEVWAYVPMNLLPHLQWLKELDYPHVYYVDGAPQAFDVNIFTPDETHVNGWGTLLVVPMRLGGDPVGADTNNDGTDDFTARSAYILMDVTDPERPPVLLAEVTHPALGFTTSRPALVKRRVPSQGGGWMNPTVNDWYLVFGSGPNHLQSATSDQTAKLFLYDLSNLSFVAGLGPLDLGLANSFVGDPAPRDWDPRTTDYVDDAVYFGTAGGTAAAQAGTLQRLRVSDLTVRTLADPGRPFLSAPYAFDYTPEGEKWVYAGSGRLLVTADARTTQQQAMYGIKEPLDAGGELTWGTVALGDLQDVTGVQVFEGGLLTDPLGALPGTPDIDSFQGLQDYIRGGRRGWYTRFQADGSVPSERSLDAVVRSQSTLLYTRYLPSADECEPEGTSTLSAVHFATGTANPTAPLGVNTEVQHPFGTVEEPIYQVRSSVSLGNGMKTGLTIVHTGTGPKVLVQGSPGDLSIQEVGMAQVAEGRQTWREIPLE